jgi:hypothetical protein
MHAKTALDRETTIFIAVPSSVEARVVSCQHRAVPKGQWTEAAGFRDHRLRLPDGESS